MTDRPGVETFDCEADAGYVSVRVLRGHVARTRVCGRVALDYDTAGRLVGYELLSSGRGHRDLAA